MALLSDCSACGRRELRGVRAVHAVATPRGPVLAITCRGCGADLSAATSERLGPAPRLLAMDG